MVEIRENATHFAGSRKSVQDDEETTRHGLTATSDEFSFLKPASERENEAMSDANVQVAGGGDTKCANVNLELQSHKPIYAQRL
jgi:hypothetical protein